MTSTHDPVRGVSESEDRADLSRVALIIPALNEAASLAELLPKLERFGLGQILVCDNGSTDDTRAIVERHSAVWVYQATPGYGAACHAGMERLADGVEIVAFIDADLSDDVSVLDRLIEPIAEGACDFVIGARRTELRQPQSTTFPQRFANWLMPMMIQLGWGHRYTDLGPFRAIRRTSLDAVGMKDRAFGWTIEMQIRAIELNLRIREIPVAHGVRRHGRSKISGTLRGVVLATYWIIRTCGLLWLTKRQRRA